MKEFMQCVIFDRFKLITKTAMLGPRIMSKPNTYNPLRDVTLKNWKSAWREHIIDWVSGFESEVLVGTYPVGEREKEKAMGLKLLENLKCNDKRVVTSLSHTRGIVVAAGFFPFKNRKNFDSVFKVGVDLEATDRKIGQGVKGRVLQDSEKKLGLSFLQCWVIKEASFKADPESKGKAVTAYVIETSEKKTAFVEGVVKTSCKTGDYSSIRYTLVSDKDWTIAFASYVKL
jgi:phosphopantetheinyl transferase (holo-ACP synthase)